MIVWAVSIYSLNFSKYSPLQISFNLCTLKNYVIFIQFWLGGQDSHLGGLSPALRKSNFTWPLAQTFNLNMRE